MKIFNRFIFSALILSASTAACYGQISVYLSPNDIESAETSSIPNVTTETFDGEDAGEYFDTIDGYSDAIGTYSTTGSAKIQPNDQYGGTGEGNYLGIVAGSSVSLALNVPAAYFGFYFSAGDAGNAIEVKSGGATLLSFNTASLIALLPKTEGSTITAMNGSEYFTLDYYGQPGQNNGTGGEPYAYLHIVAAPGTTFDQIIFSELHTATFETDNHSVRATAPTLPGSLVDVTQAVPEPSAALLTLGGLVAFAARRKRK